MLGGYSNKRLADLAAGETGGGFNWGSFWGNLANTAIGIWEGQEMAQIQQDIMESKAEYQKWLSQDWGSRGEGRPQPGFFDKPMNLVLLGTGGLGLVLLTVLLVKKGK